MRRRALLSGVAAALAMLAGPVAGASGAEFVEGNAGVPQHLVTFEAPAPAQATIDWGDGSAPTSAPVQTAPDGSGSVSGAHEYAKHGTYAVKVSDAAKPETSKSTTATVSDAPITAEGINGQTAATAGGVTLATITDANPRGVPESLRAQIDWGDGVITDGAIVSAGQPGRYVVNGSHAYPDGGSYLVVVTIASQDGGTATATAEAQFEGTPQEVPAATQGRVVDLGPSALGARPSITVDAAGTAFLAWTTPLTGLYDAITFCRLPRGATRCDLRKTLNYKPFASKTTIILAPSGRLHIVAAHIITGRGGTVVLTSGDRGQSWSARRYDVNVGIFQSAVSGAALSKDERAMYITYGPFFNISNAPLQGIARLDLGSSEVPWIGDESFHRRVVADAGVLPDGRGVALANRHPDIKEGPLVAARVVGDAQNATADAPWTPVGGAYATKIATSPGLASLLDCSPIAADPFGTRLGVISLRGLRADPVRALGVLHGDNSGCEDVDLAYDAGGGRHAVYVATADGCPSGDAASPGRGRRVRTCVVYRAARPGADFRPKTLLAEIDPESKVAGTEVGVPQGVRVGAGRDGRGWVVWRSFGDGHIRVMPTRDDTEAAVGTAHRITLKPLPDAECRTTDTVRVTATVSGPAAGRPTITRVSWSATPGVVPRVQTDRGAPFSLTAKVDPQLFRRMSSSGVIVVSSLGRATVRYRTAGGTNKVARLQLPLSFFCSTKWSVAERRFDPARR